MDNNFNPMWQRLFDLANLRIQVANMGIQEQWTQGQPQQMQQMMQPDQMPMEQQQPEQMPPDQMGMGGM